MKRITLMIFVSLLSFCTYGQLALEGFESAWTGNPAAPPGWAVYNQIGNTTWAQSTLGFTQTPPYAGDHAAYLNRENVAPSAPIPTNWLITPQFNSPNKGQLHFYSRLIYPGDNGTVFKIKIATVTDASVPVADLQWVDLVAPLTELELNPIQQQYVEKTFDIPASYVGQQIRIAFIMQGDQQERWLIDNVEVISQCPQPSNLTASNVTITSADLSWTNPADVTSWEIEVVPDTATPTGVGQSYSGTLPYPKTGLAADTAYKYFVRSSCTDGGKSVWVGPFYFITPALGDTCTEPLVIPNTSLPYTTTNNTSNFSDYYEGVPGTGCNATGNYLAGNDVVYSYTPATTGIVNISLSNTGGNAGMFIYNSCNAIGVNCIAGVTASATAAGVLPSFSVTAGTTYYIVISTNATPQTTQYTLSLQQVFCDAPTGLTAGNITQTSANLSWAAGSATSWQLAVQPANTGVPTGAGQNVNQNTNLNITATSAGIPLTEATDYEYYVRANCNDGNYSIWSGPFKFSTTQTPVNLDYSQNFDNLATHGFTLSNGVQANKWYVGSPTISNSPNFLYISNDNGVSNNYSITSASIVHAYRDIQIPVGAGNISISFDVKSNGQNNADYVRAWLVPASFVPTPGQQITTANGLQVGGNFQLTTEWTTQNVVINASTYSNSIRRLIFEWTNDGTIGAQTAGAIDNIHVKSITCSAPTTLTSGAITQSSATLNWSAPTGTPPGGYEYYYSQNQGATPQPLTTPSGSVIGATTTTVSGLNTGETYYFWVRSSCGTNSKSFWIGPVAVIISQSATGLPYSQNFDGAPSQFSFITGTQPNKWVVGSAVSNSPSKSMYITNDNGVTNAYSNGYNNTVSVVHAYKDIMVPPGATQLDFTFDLKCIGETAGTVLNDYLKMWIVPVTFTPTAGTEITAAGIGAGDRFKIGTDMNNTPNGAWNSMILDTPVSAYQNMPRRIVFEWRNNGLGVYPPPAAIDNLNITVAACSRPTNLTAINVTNTNATLDWTEPASATSWEFVYMPAAQAAIPTAPGMILSTSEYTPPVGELIYGVQYVYYVRSLCGGASGNSKWSGPFPFTLKPVNDECTSAIVLPINPNLNCTTSLNGNLTGATQSPQANGCAGTADDDVWYEFVATNDSHIINLNNIAGNITYLNTGLYSGTCGALTQVQCNSGVTTAQYFDLVVGQTYRLRVWTSVAGGNPNTTFQVCITTPPPPPSNDACSAATTLQVNPTLDCANTVAGTVQSASASPEQPTTCAGTEDDDVWYKFVATNTTHRINILNITGSALALYHTVYTGTDCATFTQAYCSSTAQSWATNLTIGQTYYIRVFSSTPTRGQTSVFDICVSTPPAPPANDNCANAYVVPASNTMTCTNPVAGTVTSATASTEATTCNATADDDDVWFEFTATSTSHFIQFTNITGSTLALSHAVYQGNVCGTLTQLYCNTTTNSIATNLIIGQTYKVRVWTTLAAMNQTTAFDLCITTPPPPAPANDNCANAIDVAVNQDPTCTLSTTGSVYGATASPEPNTCFNQNDDDDVWFKFTATSTTHLISLNNVVGSSLNLYHTLYSGTQCGALTQLYCSDANSSTASGLIVGNEYKLRVYTNDNTAQITQFDVCIRVPNTPIVVNNNMYTTEQLVNEVLINSECALVSNITSRSGLDYGGPQSISYFDANGASFPFSYGAVLATGPAILAQGPFVEDTNIAADGNSWPGDSDLSQVIFNSQPPGTNITTTNATVLEFDFVPLTNKFSFDFLFASTEYGFFQCNYSDVFAFILTDANGNSQNLAVLPDTTIPVSVLSIRDGQFSTGTTLCGSQNVEYFGQYNVDIPEVAAINFNGQTKAMTAQADVIPGQQYHIKLAIADNRNSGYNSAVFIGGGTFDVGQLDLGGDHTIVDETALCDNTTTVLDTNLNGSQYNYSWYKNGTLIAGATASTYEVTEAGTYGVKVTIDNISCSYEGTSIIEFYPDVNDLTGDPQDMTICDASGFHTFDITPNVDILTAAITNPADYTVTVHLTEQDAIDGINAIDPATYVAFTNSVEDLQTLWTRTVYSVTGCFGIKPFDLIVQDLTPVYTIDPDFSICDGTSDTIDVVITDTDPNPVTYTWTKDGAPLADTTPSITVTETGAYTVVLDRMGCTATSTVNVVVTPIPVADVIADTTVCESYVLPALSANNTYYDAATNTAVAAGTEITQTTSFNIVASSGTTPECTSQSTFTVTVNHAPAIPAMDNVTACDSYLLPALTVGNYYTAAGAAGDPLQEGDEIFASQTIFVYAETGTVPNCTSEISFEVIINTSPTADAPQDVDACDSYALPALSAGNSYWTGTNATGEQLPVGYLVEQSMDIFVFAQTATNPVCTDENMFRVNITPTPSFDLGGPYSTCVASNVTITVEGDNFDENTATYEWKTINGDPIAGGRIFTAPDFGTYTLTVTVKNCSHTESVEIKENGNVAVTITDGCENGKYIVRANDENGSFNPDTAAYAWTGPNNFEAASREFEAPFKGEYYVTVTTADGCIGENSVIVSDTGCNIQKGISPNNDGANDNFDLSSYDVKKLSIFNRYGEEVYSRNNYIDEWEGQTNNGKQLPTGTYFYMMERQTGETHTGWIYINRQD